MVIHSGILTNILRARSQRQILFRNLFKCGNAFFTSTSSSCVEEDYSDFLTWIERKAGAKISSVLSIGKSPRGGRGMFASENIKKGDRMLKIPFSAQLAEDNLPPGITSLLGNDLDPVTKVALVILHEKKLGQDSDWAPYISLLPPLKDIHSPVFWSDEELEMIRPSCVYEETLRLRNLIERDFLAVNSVSDRFPSHFRDVTLEEFTYAYQLVKSRVWKNQTRGLSMIPFADMINHCSSSRSGFANDEEQQYSEIIASRDYAEGDEVLIRYGKIPNASLLLSFGFTIPHNAYDFDVVDLTSFIAQDHNQLYGDQTSGIHRSWYPIMINEVHSMEDIPVSLRALARLLTTGCYHDLRAYEYPLDKDEEEIAAHLLMHEEMSKIIEIRGEHLSKVVMLEKNVVRRQLAVDLLEGEQRVLKSACAWLVDYCLKLSRD